MSVYARASAAASIGALTAPFAAAAIYALTGGAGEGVALMYVALIAAALYPASLPFLIVPFILLGRRGGRWPAAVLGGVLHPVMTIGAVAALDRMASGARGVGPAPRILAVVLVALATGAAAAWLAVVLTRRAGSGLGDASAG